MQILIVVTVIILAIYFFATEKFPPDLVALMILCCLMITGIVTPAEGIAGFSNTATVTVAAMFVLSNGLFKSGAIDILGSIFIRNLKKNFWFGVLSLMLIAGLLSAFINDTAVVALFLPMVIAAAEKTKTSPTKLLMPLSFGALFGGVCTLIGTSTNILVSNIAEKRGYEPFGMFELSSFGLIILFVGIIYMALIGIRMLPDRESISELTEKFQLQEYITEIILKESAKSVGYRIKDSPLVKDLDIDILQIHRGGKEVIFPRGDTVLQAGDILRVRCNIDTLTMLQKREGIVLVHKVKLQNKDFDQDNYKLVEAMITPYSSLRGNTIKGFGFRDALGASVLAIRHRGIIMREKLTNTVLVPGDVLLLEIRQDHLDNLKKNKNFLIISQEENPLKMTNRIFPATAIMFSVVVTAALGIIPIVESAILGSVLMVLTGCLSLEEAYRSIEWKVIFLLAGVLTLGVALEKTGSALLIADYLIKYIGTFGNEAMVAAFFIITLIFTNFMSNNASAALLAPIAILSAEATGISPRPLLMAVTYAASLSLITPVGYQTNLMIFSPGNYRFSDFVKIGTPLNLIFIILAVILIPILFPF